MMTANSTGSELMRGIQGNPQGFEQHSFVERLAKVCNRAGAHALFTRAGGIVRGNDHDREVRSGTVEHSLHICARNAGHLQIEHEAVRLIGKPALEKFIAGREATRGVSGGLKQPHQRLAYRFIIVDYCNHSWHAVEGKYPFLPTLAARHYWTLGVVHDQGTSSHGKRRLPCNSGSSSKLHQLRDGT